MLPSPGISADQFRAIFGAFPAGVSIVTTRDTDGTLNGLTATSVCSLSLDPPFLLVCVGKDSTTLPALQRRRRFVVNFLLAGRELLARRFASDLSDKFLGVNWQPSPASSLPILTNDSVAYAVCKSIKHIRAGDHVIVVGLIEEGDVLVRMPPLMYCGGTFRGWPDDVAAESDAVALAGREL